MNPDKFRALYAFTDWANDRVLSQAARLSEDDYRRAFVEGLDDKSLLRVVEYRTTKGVSHAEPLWQLMLHVANHSTDHRSQVATLLTQLGHPPQALDMIAYFRLNE